MSKLKRRTWLHWRCLIMGHRWSVRIFWRHTDVGLDPVLFLRCPDCMKTRPLTESEVAHDVMEYERDE